MLLHVLYLLPLSFSFLPSSFTVIYCFFSRCYSLYLSFFDSPSPYLSSRFLFTSLPPSCIVLLLIYRCFPFAGLLCLSSISLKFLPHPLPLFHVLCLLNFSYGPLPSPFTVMHVSFTCLFYLLCFFLRLLYSFFSLHILLNFLSLTSPLGPFDCPSLIMYYLFHQFFFLLSPYLFDSSTVSIFSCIISPYPRTLSPSLLI